MYQTVQTQLEEQQLLSYHVTKAKEFDFEYDSIKKKGKTSKTERIFKLLQTLKFCGHSYVGGHLGFSFSIFNFIVNLFTPRNSGC